MERAVRAAEAVFEEAVEALRPGMTERELAVFILRRLYETTEGPSFPPIVLSGPNSALPHGMPSERRIEEHEPIIIDMGCRIGGYCSDMTRTVFLGEPGGRIRDAYRAVREAQVQATRAIRAGITGREADRVARKVIRDAGFGGRFTHALGHGVGLLVHEPPQLSRRGLKRLRAGSVVTVEPGIYLPGEGGVRLENMVVVEEGGARVITKDAWFYEF